MSSPADNSSFDTLFSGGRKPGRLAPEKSNFAQTCNLLSQYLKEKRTLGAGITPKMELKEDFPISRSPSMMNFLTNMENPDEYVKDRAAGAAANGEQLMGFRLPAGETEPPSAAQMTIFYGGKVLVFNDLPSVRAEEIMAMAGKGISSSSRSAAAVSASISDKVIEPVAGNGINLAGVGEQIHQQQPSQISGDMPIARRASLHRFFEKRKDRVSARAPYQLNQHHHAVSSKSFGEEFNGNYHQSSKQFDLNL